MRDPSNGEWRTKEQDPVSISNMILYDHMMIRRDMIRYEYAM